LKIPGEFNVSNALAALKVARILKIPDKISFKALSQYRGAWRRFEEKRVVLKRTIVQIMPTRKMILVSDYGHHPTEIRVTLKAAREKYPKRKIWLVFQPHQYQRTYYLFKDFVKVFREVLAQKWVDKLIITGIYDVAGREDERIKKKVNSKKLVEVINQPLHKRRAVACRLCQGEYISSIDGVVNYLKKNLRGGEVVIIMGAGDIYNLAKFLGKKVELKSN
jgi:UDP-N-acetylmuramate--alanine ligase